MGDSNYIEAIKAYRKALQDALKIADDVFKAPELTVATATSVVRAAWDMQVEYAAMMNKSHGN